MNKKLKRNDPCPCGSGKKYKQCCWGKEQPKSDLNKGSFFSQKIGGSNSSSLKRKFTAKVIKSDKPEDKSENIPALPDPIEKAFAKTIETIKEDELPPAPEGETLPEQDVPANYKKWEPKKD